MVAESSKIAAVDIGGQGVKFARFEQSRTGQFLVGEVTMWRPAEWSRFEDDLLTLVNYKGCHVGVSCSGFVNSTSGIVTHSRAAGWRDYPIVDRLIARGAASAVVLNDAEAHLMAHCDEPLPLLNVALGTSVGIAVLDDRGRVVRPRRSQNLDLGGFKLRTSASPGQVWDALGNTAYHELVRTLGERDGVSRYGARLGAFLGQLSHVFQPATIVVSGGLTEAHWVVLHRALLDELRAACPQWLEQPIVKRSPHGSRAALVGAAIAASNPKCLE